MAIHSPCSGKNTTILYKRKSNNNNNINNNNTINSWWAHHNNNKASPNHHITTIDTIQIVTISNKVTHKDILAKRILFYSTQEIRIITVIFSINSHKIWQIKIPKMIKLLSQWNILCRRIQIQIKKSIILDSLPTKSVLSSPHLHKPPNSKQAWALQQIFPALTPASMLSATMLQGRPHLSTCPFKTGTKWANQSNKDCNKSSNWKT